jgi:hypothetical protein
MPFKASRKRADFDPLTLPILPSPAMGEREIVMMRRLFWRIFAAIWIATVVVLLAFAWITTSNFEKEKIPGLEITRLQAALDDLLGRTSHELHHDGEDATRSWLRTAAGFGPIGVYLFTADGNELLGRPTSDNVRAAAAAAIAEPPSGDNPNGATRGSERLRARAIHTRDGRIYAEVAALEGTFFSRLLSRRPRTFWTNIGVAMIVSALFSLFLAWYVSAPLTAFASDAAPRSLRSRPSSTVWPSASRRWLKATGAWSAMSRTNCARRSRASASHSNSRAAAIPRRSMHRLIGSNANRTASKRCSPRRLNCRASKPPPARRATRSPSTHCSKT